MEISKPEHRGDLIIIIIIIDKSIAKVKRKKKIFFSWIYMNIYKLMLELDIQEGIFHGLIVANKVRKDGDDITCSVI